MIRPIEFSSVRGGPSVDYVVYTFSRRTKCYRRLRNNYACTYLLNFKFFVTRVLTWESCIIANTFNNLFVEVIYQYYSDMM